MKLQAGGKETHVEDERGKQPAVEGRGAASAVGDEELPGGESRPSFFSPPYPFSSISRPQIQLRARRAAPSASAREIERARAAGQSFCGNRQRVRLGAASRASAPPPLRLIAASRRLAPPSAQTAAYPPRPGDGRRLATKRAWAPPSGTRMQSMNISYLLN